MSVKKLARVEDVWTAWIFLVAAIVFLFLCLNFLIDEQYCYAAYCSFISAVYQSGAMMCIGKYKKERRLDNEQCM